MLSRHRRILALWIVCALWAPALSAQAPAPRPEAFNPTDVIPFDTSVRTGTLPNGLRFFIRQNGRPAKRLSLRLAVKGGSLEEADDQQGLAHFLEHMAFNGSEHFKPGELVSYFESAGMRLGPHVNAYTAFDETVYMFDLPTDAQEVVSKGLTALADFAGGLTLDPSEIDKERGVVVEEWRGGLGAESRINDKQFPVLFSQSRYAERLPIGKPEIIRTAPPERLRAFYDAWYRPDRMAIVAVGDNDPVQLEATIRSTFGSLKPRGPVVPVPDQTIPLHPQLLISVASDPEMTQSMVQILRKRPIESELLVGDYRRALVERLIGQMFSERFQEIAQSPSAPFLGAGTDGGTLGQTVSTFSLGAAAKEGGILASLAALTLEKKRVEQYGFTASELDRAKKSMAAFYERAYNERATSESGIWAAELLRHFLEDEPVPGIAYEYRLVQFVLAGITLEEVSTVARARLSEGSPVILAISPAKPDLPVPTEEELRAALTSADAVAVTPWHDDTSLGRTLLEKKPEPAKVTGTRSLADLGVTIVQFANGVEAWLKPTDFKSDQVLFTMSASGGASLAPQSGFLNASLAARHVSQSGFAGMTPLDVEKILAGQTVSAAPFIGLSMHGIGGAAAPAQLETALQLLYQEFTAPNSDSDAFELMRGTMEAALDRRGITPAQVFGEKVDQVNTSSHYTSEPLSPAAVGQLDPAKMLEFYRERFSNAADFTFFMVGTFKVDEVVPLLARYIGSLPSTGNRSSQVKDLAIRFPSAVERAVVQKGREPRSETVVSFFADPGADLVEQEKIIAAVAVLEASLRALLREQLGQTYGVSVGLSQDLGQRGGGHIQVSFGAAPENIAGMTDRVFEEVKRLQQDGPPADLTARVKEAARREIETNLRQNGYWLRRLETAQLMGGSPSAILTRPARIDAITPATLKEAFKQYFPLDRYTVVTLVPESAAGQP